MIAEQEHAVKAARQFKSVIDKIDPSQWEMKMPPDFKSMGTDDSKLREIVNYHAYDDAWIPDMLAGRTMDEVSTEKWKGDLLGDDPIGNYTRFNDEACVAIEKLDDPDRIVHCSFGDFSAREYLLQVISFRGLRAYDIAKAVGLDTELPSDLVQGMWDLLTPHADEWRRFGVYDPAIPCADDAPPQRRLLNTLGYE